MINKRAFSYTLTAIRVSLIVAATLSFVAQDSIPQPEHVITTLASQWHHTKLADGTAVHVDARSTVKVEYTDDTRIVSVDRGSAVFEVAKDPRRPFIARTQLIDATAVGTRFGVSIDPGVTITVSEGAVKVTARGQRGTGTGIVLNAGEQLRVPDGGSTAPTQVKVNAERKLDWANGWLTFEGETVGEVMNEFNRRNVVQIDLDQPELAARPMHGFFRFRVDSSAAFARYLAETNDLALIEDRSGSVLRLRPKERVEH